MSLTLGFTIVFKDRGVVLSVRGPKYWSRVAYQWPLGFHASRGD